MNFLPPDKTCCLCPRLAAFRQINQQKFPGYHNGPVESFGRLDSQVLIVGLAPGLNGANQTNRPFTNDYAGDILYPALHRFGFAQGSYQKHKNDGFELLNVRVSNAVRCVPPQNKVTGEETKTCGAFLRAEIAAMPRLKIIVCLGTVAHNAVLQALSLKKSAYPFAHGAQHQPAANLTLLDSYHTSRYNINTGVLTVEMFDQIIKKLPKLL